MWSCIAGKHDHDRGRTPLGRLLGQLDQAPLSQGKGRKHSRGPNRPAADARNAQRPQADRANDEQGWRESASLPPPPWRFAPPTTRSDATSRHGAADSSSPTDASRPCRLMAPIPSRRPPAAGPPSAASQRRDPYGPPPRGASTRTPPPLCRLRAWPRKRVRSINARLSVVAGPRPPPEVAPARPEQAGRMGVRLRAVGHRGQQ